MSAIKYESAGDGGAAFYDYLEPLRRWGRWGADDEVGAVNMVSPSTVVDAARTIQLGEVVSLAREFPTQAQSNNLHPAQHYLRTASHDDDQGSASDYIGINFHGTATTHVDALCHLWDREGMWNGHHPDEAIRSDGAVWGGVEQLAGGIVARGLLIDVARARAEGFVEHGAPVTGEELARICAADGLVPRPGDALVIHSGREAWERAHGELWGTRDAAGEMHRPGLDASCLEFIADADCSVVVWDMMDAHPNRFGILHTAHSMINVLGVVLVDNALLEPLAQLCDQHDRREFMLCIAPLRIVGGTGSPVNPIAVL